VGSTPRPMHDPRWTFFLRVIFFSTGLGGFGKSIGSIFSAVGMGRDGMEMGGVGGVRYYVFVYLGFQTFECRYATTTTPHMMSNNYLLQRSSRLVCQFSGAVYVLTGFSIVSAVLAKSCPKPVCNF